MQSDSLVLEQNITEEDRQVMLAEEDKHQRLRRNLQFVFLLILAVGVGLLLRAFVVEFTMVDGDSMLPTLETGERVMVSKLSYVFGSPGRYDVIICNYPNHDSVYVKRVMGLPGETLSINDGVVYINGEALTDDPGVHSVPQDYKEVTIPEGYVFVMGDNRDVSMDSRTQSVGCVPLSYIKGKGICVAWPISAWRGL